MPLIDQETWDRTQALLAQRATGLKPGRGYRPGQGLLGGLLHCAKCGGTFYHRKHRTHGQIRHYYICTTNRLYHSRCDAKLIPIPQLDQDVWNLIESYLQEPEELIRKVIAADQTHSSNVQELAEQETEAIQSFEKIETEVASIWAEQQAHSWPVSWVAPKLNQLNQRRETVQNHLAEIRRQRATILVDQNQTQAVTAALARIRAKLQQGLTDEDKYHIIRLVVAGGTIRTIGTGFQKTAQITIQLKWGEVASPELPKH